MNTIMSMVLFRLLGPIHPVTCLVSAAGVGVALRVGLGLAYLSSSRRYD